MRALVGTGHQLRLFLRLGRLQLVLWPVLVGGLLWAMSDSLTALYPSAADRAEYAAVNEASPVLKALNGPGHALDTEGGILVFEVGAYLLLVGAVAAALAVVRHTRREEESGRAELTGSVPAGRLAALAGGLAGTAVLAALTAAAATLAMVGAGLPTAGSLAYGLSVLAVMLVFAGVAAVTAQVSVRAATASGLAGVLVGLCYALRGVADVADSPLAWASPFGWVQAVRPFGDERWWPLLLALAVAVALAGLAAVLRVRRDDGAGLFPARPGPARAARSLRGVWAVRRRQARGPLVGFGLLTVLLAAAFGLAGEDVTAVFETGAGLDALLGMDEVGARDAYFSMVVTLLTMLVTAFGLTTMSRVRADEESGLAELELSTATRRLPWVVSAFTVSLVGCLVLAVAAGLVLAGSYAAVTADAEAFADLVAAPLLQLPAVAVLVSLALALLGVVPRAVPAVWAVLGACAVVGFLGAALQLDQVVRDLSPYSHVAQLPDLTLDAGALVLVGVAAALAVVGVGGLLRRDV